MIDQPKKVSAQPQAQPKNDTRPKTTFVHGDFYAYFTPLARLNAYSPPVGCFVAYL